MERNIFIISGGIGFGKTSLLESIERLGYCCGNEFARELIKSEQEKGGDLLPWKNPKHFQLEILAKRQLFYDSVLINEIAFTDRAIPDQIAFARLNGFKTPDVLMEASLKYRYAPIVFVTPPWREIFKNDEVRSESFEMANTLHNLVIEIYRELSYKIVDLPLSSVEDRKMFVFQTILKYFSNGH